MADKQLGNVLGVTAAEGDNSESGGLENLLTANQWGAEAAITGWAAETNCAVARSTSESKYGAASLRLSATAAGDMDATTPTGTDGIAVTPGKVYTAGAWFKTAVTAQACRVDIFWFKSDGAASDDNADSAGETVNDSTTGFNFAHVTATAPDDAAFAAVKVVVLSADAASELHYVDGAFLVESALLDDLVIPGGTDAQTGFWHPSMMTIGAMKERLKEIDAYYTDAVLNEMTVNDMVYAIRVSDFPDQVTTGA